MVTKVNLIDKLHTDSGNYFLCKRLILHANMEICCSFESFSGGTFGFSYREDLSCINWNSTIRPILFQSLTPVVILRYTVTPLGR